MATDEPVLCIESKGPGSALRVSLHRDLTTIGSDPAAHVRLADLPARWAVVHRRGEHVEVRRLSDGALARLSKDKPIHWDSHSLCLEAQAASSFIPIQPLVDSLSDVEEPGEALERMLDGILAATGAGYGAVILREGSDYTVSATAERGETGGLAAMDARGLLSDHIVRDVLARGEQVWFQEGPAHERYATVPSVVSLKLRSVACVPMCLHESTMGALFIGSSDPRRVLTEQHARDIHLLSSMVIPLLIQLRRRRAGTGPAQDLIVGECDAILSMKNLVERVGASDLSVLIQGETGTGKELVARALHAASSRAEKPLVAINCASLPDSLLEAELFGHRKGAFTGAVQERKGRIEQAHNSTLFLDEVGDMPLPMQAALLRVLESREVVRLGENLPKQVDFRLVAATHRDLDAEVEQGRFRRDLLYRLKEFVIGMPPLRDRSDDVLLLAQLFLRQAQKELSLPPLRLARKTAAKLLSYGWPGNVRELRATMRRAAILCDSGEIQPEHLALPNETSRPAPACVPAPTSTDLFLPLAQARDNFVKDYVTQVIERCKGDREEAARSLEISIRSLYRYIKDPV